MKWNWNNKPRSNYFRPAPSWPAKITNNSGQLFHSTWRPSQAQNRHQLQIKVKPISAVLFVCFFLSLFVCFCLFVCLFVCCSSIHEQKQTHGWKSIHWHWDVEIKWNAGRIDASAKHCRFRCDKRLWRRSRERRRPIIGGEWDSFDGSQSTVR